MLLFNVAMLIINGTFAIVDHSTINSFVCGILVWSIINALLNKAIS